LDWSESFDDSYICAGFVCGARLSDFHGRPGDVRVVADRADRIPHRHAAIPRRHCALYQSNIEPDRAESLKFLVLVHDSLLAAGSPAVWVVEGDVHVSSSQVFGD
jgi:hypothetical protein